MLLAVVPCTIMGLRLVNDLSDIIRRKPLHPKAPVKTIADQATPLTPKPPACALFSRAVAMPIGDTSRINAHVFTDLALFCLLQPLAVEQPVCLRPWHHQYRNNHYRCNTISLTGKSSVMNVQSVLGILVKVPPPTPQPNWIRPGLPCSGGPRSRQQ